MCINVTSSQLILSTCHSLTRKCPLGASRQPWCTSFIPLPQFRGSRSSSKRVHLDLQPSWTVLRPASSSFQWDLPIEFPGLAQFSPFGTRQKRPKMPNVFSAACCPSTNYVSAWRTSRASLNSSTLLKPTACFGRRFRSGTRLLVRSLAFIWSWTWPFCSLKFPVYHHCNHFLVFYARRTPHYFGSLSSLAAHLSAV